MARPPKDCTAQRNAPRLPLNPLDVGPTTVLGTRPSMVDPIVQQLGDVLERQALQAGAGDLEVEIRLGIVSEKRLAADRAPENKTSKTWQQDLPSRRIDLPFKTEAPLQRGGGFEYRFAPGLTRESFGLLDRKLRRMCTSGQMKCMHSQEVCADDYYVVPGLHKGVPVRVTHDLNGNVSSGDPARSFVKHKHWTMDFWSGSKAPHFGPVFDYRMAVNKEEILNGFKVMPGHIWKMRRTKRTSSFKFRAWRIDLTSVAAIYPREEGSGPEQATPPEYTYEVEIELVTPALNENIAARSAGRPHRLWELLSDFVGAARDLAVLAGELDPMPLPAALPVITDASTIISEQDRLTFRKVWGDTEPVIGHYLYRLAKSSGSLLQASTTTTTKDERTLKAKTQETTTPKPHMVSQGPERFNITTSYPTPAENKVMQQRHGDQACQSPRPQSTDGILATGKTVSSPAAMAMVQHQESLTVGASGQPAVSPGQKADTPPSSSRILSRQLKPGDSNISLASAQRQDNSSPRAVQCRPIPTPRQATPGASPMSSPNTPSSPMASPGASRAAFASSSPKVEAQAVGLGRRAAEAEAATFFADEFAKRRRKNGGKNVIYAASPGPGIGSPIVTTKSFEALIPADIKTANSPTSPSPAYSALAHHAVSSSTPVSPKVVNSAPHVAAITSPPADVVASLPACAVPVVTVTTPKSDEERATAQVETASGEEKASPQVHGDGVDGVCPAGQKVRSDDDGSSKLKIRKKMHVGFGRAAMVRAPKWAAPKAFAAVCGLPGPLPRS